MAPSIFSIGECMAEICHEGDGSLRMGFGGDSLNTAVYLARLLGPGRVGYVTRLGGDPWSRQMYASWRDEGLDVSQVEIVEGRTVGLYAITTDPMGERSFTYWRGDAPARELLSAEGHEALATSIGEAELVYFTGVSLAILPDEGRTRLIAAAKAARDKGALVAVDPNLRLNLWSSAEARRWLSAAYGAVSLVLTSEEEERAIFGAGNFVERLNAAGCRHVVARRGPAGASYWHEDLQDDVPAEAVEEAVDTTGAGDAFNAGYLAGLVTGLPPKQAAMAGCKLAAAVVCAYGAVIPRDAMPSGILNQ